MEQPKCKFAALNKGHTRVCGRVCVRVCFSLMKVPGRTLRQGQLEHLSTGAEACREVGELSGILLELRPLFAIIK